MEHPPIILFDGICNFCNSAVNFTIKRDKNSVIKFAPLQSPVGQQLLQQYNLPLENMQSFAFVENGKAYTRSTAAIKVCSHLRGLWPMMKIFMIVPAGIRDGSYNWIAKNRYKWFGTQDACMIPTPDVRERFL